MGLCRYFRRKKILVVLASPEFLQLPKKFFRAFRYTVKMFLPKTRTKITGENPKNTDRKAGKNDGNHN
nr:MAG TPA: hypothetical protein [Caudoviricetes sp.]